MNVRTYWILAVILLGTPDINGKDKWSEFLLTQEWPQTACLMCKSERKGCKIPSYINSFTIHGLWPSSSKGEGPINCEGPKFNSSLIKNLTSELDTSWPNIFTNTPRDDFWEHEWMTHGKCALSLPETGSEYFYFRKTLDLMREWNASRYLNEFNILPNKKYNYSEIANAIKKKLKVQPSLSCYSGKSENGKRIVMLAEIRLCMDKTFRLKDCRKIQTTLYFKSNKMKRSTNTNPCPKSSPFLFPKIVRK